jgi:hypothetical protein
MNHPCPCANQWHADIKTNCEMNCDKLKKFREEIQGDKK